ncbi:hypothetical protein Q7P37_002390 [Cladosporium fusiforme]
MSGSIADLAGLTFGIELEFIAIYPKGQFRFGDMDDDIMAAISLAINAKGIKATGHESLDDDVPINSDKSEPFDSWTVDEEGGLLLSKAELAALDSDENLLVQPMELSSRKMWLNAEDWQSEVAAVLNVLDSFCAKGCRFITNSTTGLHVHIGFGDTRMNLRTAKGVLQLCTAFEDRLDVLYPINRIDENAALKGADGEHFNANLSWHFANNIKTSLAKNVCHWLAEIEECTSLKELEQFYKVDGPQPVHPSAEMIVNKAKKSFKIDAHYSTLNVDNLYTPDRFEDGRWELDGEPTGTLEFRQHAGTLEFQDICAHVELLRTVLLSHYYNRFSHATDQAAEAQASNAANMVEQHLLELNMVEHDTADKLGALEAQNCLEKWQRTNYNTVAEKIESKRAAGAYADLRTLPLDVLAVYTQFTDCNRASIGSFEQLSTLARTTIFHQLNASD